MRYKASYYNADEVLGYVEIDTLGFTREMKVKYDLKLETEIKGQETLKGNGLFYNSTGDTEHWPERDMRGNIGCYLFFGFGKSHIDYWDNYFNIKGSIDSIKLTLVEGDEIKETVKKIMKEGFHLEETALSESYTGGVHGEEMFVNEIVKEITKSIKNDLGKIESIAKSFLDTTDYFCSVEESN